jgi:hypothetical protein
MSKRLYSHVSKERIRPIVDSEKESELYNKFLGEFYRLKSKLRNKALDTENKTSRIDYYNGDPVDLMATTDYDLKRYYEN